MSNAPFDDDIDALAGEYVLGLMSDSETANFEARIAREPAVRAAVAAMRERLLELDTSARPAAPSGDLWSRIDSRLDAKSGNVVDLASRRRRDIATPLPTASAPSRRAFWRGFAAASILALVGGGITARQLSLQKPRLVVVLLDAQAQPVSIVETYEGQRIRVVPLGTIEVPEGKALQVWTLPNKETGPVSMGLLPAASAAVLEGPTLPPPKLDQLYEITIEQAGGSPTGRPTGPIVGKGFAKLPQI